MCLFFIVSIRCLNASLKMDMSDDDAHRLCEIMNQATTKLTQNVNVEELIWAVSVAGAPDAFLCAGA